MGDRTVLIGRDERRGRCVLGGRARIIVPLTSPDAAGLAAELRAVSPHPHDLLEWRVDAVLAGAVPAGGAAAGGAAAGGAVPAGVPDAGAPAGGAAPGAPGGSPRGPGNALEEAARVVLAGADVPVLATVRTRHEGGAADLTDARLHDLLVWLAHRFDAVDVEVARDGYLATIREAHAAGAVVVASHHDFSGTPPDARLREVLAAMEAVGADVAKVACMAQGPEDLLAVLGAQVWARDALGIPVIGIAMGAAGALSRVAGAAVGCAATFATVGRPSAPGQLETEDVRRLLDLLGA